MFLKNCWYVAAEAHEIGRLPFARTICGEKIAFWRKEDGTPVAFQDRCCHRRLPLRKGTLIGDRLRCHYHGLEFDASGACVQIPGQVAIPPGAQVRTYPVVARYKWIWIWMGDPALADPAAIPDCHWREDPAWGDKGTYFHVRCNYRLICDNLLDQSHIVFVHASTLGSGAINDKPQQRIFRDDHAVKSVRWVLDCTPPPAYRALMGWSEDQRVDRWLISEFRPPSTVRLFTGAAPGAAQGQPFGFTDLLADVPAGGLGLRNINCITPETETTAHYFWCNPMQAPDIGTEIVDRMFGQILRAFEQDWEVLELQQANWDEQPVINVNADGSFLAARQLLDRWIAEEARSRPAAAAE
jgi:vanillate O-demethylase monooxygenase subunit